MTDLERHIRELLARLVLKLTVGTVSLPTRLWQRWQRLKTPIKVLWAWRDDELIAVVDARWFLVGLRYLEQLPEWIALLEDPERIDQVYTEHFFTAGEESEGYRWRKRRIE